MVFFSDRLQNAPSFSIFKRVIKPFLRWLETVSSTFQGVDFDES